MDKQVLKDVKLSPNGHLGGHCVVCKKEGKDLNHVKFIYGINGIESTNFYFLICTYCYYEKVVDKHWDDLKTFIPLIRLKPRRKTNKLMRSGNLYKSYSITYTP